VVTPDADFMRLLKSGPSQSPDNPKP